MSETPIAEISRFEDYKQLLTDAVTHYRRMEIETADAIARQVRDIIGDSRHPEDLGFLEYLEYKRYMGECKFQVALNQLTKVEQYFLQLNSPVRKTVVIHDRALTYFRMNDFVNSISCYQQALELLDDSMGEDNRASVYNNMGECYLYLKQYNLALDYCFRALKIREKRGIRGLGSSFYNLSVIYSEMSEYHKSLEFGLKALEKYREAKDENSVASTMNTIGIAYLSLREFDSALPYFEESLAIREARGEKSRIAIVLHGMGNLYFGAGDNEKSRFYHEKALSLRRELGDNEYIAGSLLNLATLSLAQKQPREALKHLLEAESYEIKRPANLAEVHLTLSKTYELLGEFEKSCTYLKLHLAEISKIWEEVKSTNLAEMKTKIEMDRKEQELRFTQDKNRELEEKNKLIENQKIHLEETLADLRKSELSLSFIKSEMSHEIGYSRIIGDSESIRSIIALMRKVASSDDTSVLITGESGTGKELVARGIHEMSSRRKHYFYGINASAVSGSLFESEFFGHEKGAFTGADSLKPGWFEVANGGTLFLDEIGNMPIEQQIKLLRALDDRNIIRVGARREISVNVRVISATNMNLTEMIGDKTFREDLYHRLAVFVIHIPPLRERLEDIPVLTEYFVRYFTQKMKKSILRIDPGVFSSLMAYTFPGNVRELSNMIEKAIIISDSSCLQSKHLSFPEKKQHNGTRIEEEFTSLEDMEKTMLIKALLSTGFNQAKAAKLLSISPKAMERRIAKFGITKEGFLLKIK